MRFDPGKAWPHPVLRPSSYGDDYPRAEFEVEIEVARVKGSTAVEVSAEFELSDPDLLALVEAEAADYVLLIRAPKTHHRQLLRSTAPGIRASIPAGSLSGRVEFTPFLVCTRAQEQFHAEGWHQDFSGRKFDLEPGAVLAEDKEKVYWIDTADEGPLGAIFEHGERPDLADGYWQLQLDGERIRIEMSATDSNRYRVARELANRTPDGQYLMNGLYLPALIQVLNVADRDPDAYGSFRWFAALARRLEAVGCDPLGSQRAERLVDAQKVLEAPFGKMPIIASAENES